MYYEEEEEQMFLPEANILERVHYETPTASRSEIQNDPVKRFLYYTNAIALNLSSNRTLPMNRDDIDAINRQAERVRNPRYKNPLGFVLGYYLVKDGTNSISTRNLEFIRKNLDTFEPDKLLKIEDVVRYGRLWLTQL